MTARTTNASETLFWPYAGDRVSFRGVAYVPAKEEGCFAVVKNGDFICWVSKEGDPLALVRTEYGETVVRWSMIDGIESPDGLLDR